MSEQRAWGFGLASVVTSGASAGTLLEAWFPAPELGAAPAGVEAPEGLAAAAGVHDVRRIRTEVVRVEIDLAEPPRDTSDAYLRLHLLSHRLVRPHSLNLDGIFGVLPNVVWTSAGPCPVDDFETTRLRLRAVGEEDDDPSMPDRVGKARISVVLPRDDSPDRVDLERPCLRVAQPEAATGRAEAAPRPRSQLGRPMTGRRP